MKTNTIQTIKKATMRFAALLAAVAAPSAFAASQTWSNAPTSGEWSNAVNWIGNAVPGANFFQNGGQTTDNITFNSPLFGGIGGTSIPFRNSDTNRQVKNIIFDTVGCGSYLLVSSNGFAIGMSVTLDTAPAGVTINAAVTNAQVVDNLLTRLQSSQNGSIGFTNNSTTENATLTINNLTNSSANTRPLFLRLAGSNTGANTIGYINDNAGANGAILMDKIDAGRWVLTGANELPQKTSAGNIARVQILEGTLVVQNSASLGTISAANISITNTGVLQIDGISLQNLGMTLRNGGTIRMNGSGTINGLVVANQAGNTCNVTTTSASDVFTIGGISAVSGGLVDSTLNVNGTGTVVLGNTVNTYVGKWSFNAVTNQIAGLSVLGTGPSAHLSAGAILDTTALGASAFNPTTAAFGANGTGTGVGTTASTIIADPAGTFDLATGSKNVLLTYTPVTFTGDITRPALYIAQGTLSLGGNGFTINNASGTPLGAGTYRLIEQATGSVTSGSTSYAIVTGSGLVAGHVGEIVVTGGNVDLVVSAHVAANLQWFGGNPDNKWDKLATSNWTNGVTLVQFGTGDEVTFDSVGSATPSVDIVETVLPVSAKVDTSANDYTLSGVGSIAGATSLTKVGTGNLILSTINNYVGGTVVSNGTLRLGVSEAVPSSGTGNVALYSPATLDMNGFNNSINGLIGNGTVDISSGGASVLTVGLNGSSSTFTGVLANASGTLGLTKAGNGTLTLPGAHTYSGPTTIIAGLLVAQNANSLGSSTLAVAGGGLRASTSININSLTGAAGSTVQNSSGSGAIMLNHTGVGNYSGVISPATGGSVGIRVLSGSLQLNGVNTYTNGTFVASGATFAVGAISPGASGTAGTGGISASNNSVVSLPSSLAVAAAPGNNITNVDVGGTITLSSASQGNSFGGQFFGGAISTNIFVGPGSIGGAISFSNFLGTVVISNGASWRWFNGNGGGDNTTFDIRGSATLFSRDANTIRLGALVGENGAGIGNPSVSGFATYIIGAKNLSTVYAGIISGSNNIVKAGSGSLTLNGARYYTNIVTLPDPFEPTNIVSFTLYSNAVTYTGTTTVSNGTLAVVAPNNLTNSPNITLAGGTLDVSAIGYATNQTIIDFNLVEQVTNTVVVTTSTLDILSGQSLNGQGSITGSLNAQPGSTVNVGAAIGTIAVTGNVNLEGTVNMNINRTNSPNKSDRITAASFTGAGATLNVTDTGTPLIQGTVLQLFSGANGAFTTVNLPTASSANPAVTYSWQNDIAANGTVTLLTGVNPTPVPMTTVVSGSTLELNWPADHKGWTLQVQTNALNVGIAANWFTVAGSTATNQMFMPIVPGNPTVFYRMILPLP